MIILPAKEALCVSINGHVMKEVYCKLSNSIIAIDLRMVTLIQDIWELGIPTVCSCEGDPGYSCAITFKLESVQHCIDELSALDHYITDDEITVRETHEQISLLHEKLIPILRKK